MQPEHAAFLNAIEANPKDETARLVFADWLDERDDPRAAWLRDPILGARFASVMVDLASSNIDHVERGLSKIKSLGAAKESLLPQVIEILENPDVGVEVIAAAEAVEAMGPSAVAALPALLKAYDRIEDRGYSNLPEVIGSFGAAAVEAGAVSSLVGLFYQGNQVGCNGQSAILRMGPTAIPALIREFDHTDGGSDVIGWIVSTLAAFGADAVPHLLEAQKHGKDETNRWLATRALCSMDSERYFPDLIGWLQTPDDHIRSETARVLAEMADYEGKRAEDAVPSLVAALGDVSYRVRMHAAEAIGFICGPRELVEGPLLAMRTDAEQGPRVAAAEALGRLGLPTFDPYVRG